MKKQNRNVLYGILIAVLSAVLILLAVGVTNWRVSEATRHLDRIVAEESVELERFPEIQITEIRKIRSDARGSIDKLSIELLVIFLVLIAIVIAAVIIYSLYKDNKRAEKYERARNEMIRGISHDLRTPLTVVKGNIKGIQDGVANTPEKQEQYLSTAYSRVVDIENLLEDLFEMFSCETGELKMNFERTNLNEFLKDVAKKSVAGQRVEFDLPREPIYVKFDKKHMKRVFDNLINNAVKHSGCGDKLRIYIGARLTERGEVEMVFQDNGKGVRPENLPRIFGEFFKEDESRNTKASGSGLGLFIVRKIIEGHGGKITAENANGLKFTIYFKAEMKQINQGKAL